MEAQILQKKEETSEVLNTPSSIINQIEEEEIISTYSFNPKKMIPDNMKNKVILKSVLK